LNCHATALNCPSHALTLGRASFCLFLFAGMFQGSAGKLFAQATVSLGTLALPTYDEGKPDPNPPFDVYATTEFNYPYTLRSSLSGRKTDHTWRSVVLENEYLKCTILPDLGGHIYTCVDKINGQSMFYANPSIKKAEIGHRGAWAAFGVEYNFPVSHNWVSLSPVDFSYRTNNDGSASVTISNIDRPYGMQWQVELVLKPKSSLLEERVTLYNRSDVRHRYYWWDNAGVEVWDDSRIEYPMQFVASHGFTDVYRWPILAAGGKDLTFVKNHTDGPVSYFSHGSHETFMGVWNPKTNAGVAQFSEYREIPAKKIWSWGSDADGMAWREALSDNHSAYVEVQAGLFRNQETYAFLDPGQTIHFSEYWMPVRGTGGISRANKTGVVKLEANGSQVSVTLNVNTPVRQAQLSLTQGKDVLWSGTANLDPATTWSQTAAFTKAGIKATFSLKDRDGNIILTQTDGQYDWDPESSVAVGPQPPYAMPSRDKRTEDDWLQLGSDEEVNGQVVQAMTTYQSALQKYPESLSLSVAEGRLAASLQRDQEAAPLLQAAQKRDTPNSIVAYYLGIAEQGLGHLSEAETSYDVAYRQALVRAPAAIKLGEMQAQAGNLQAALIFFKAAVDAAPEDQLAQEEYEAVTRSIGITADADMMAQQGLDAYPTSDFLREDLGKPDLHHLAADPYRVLRVAAEYMRLGLYKRAIDVLDAPYVPVPADQREPGSVLPQQHPLVIYYSAYCKSKLGADDPQNWSKASALSAALVFPSTETDTLVLNAALEANKNDATAQYLFGTLLYSEGLYDAGIAHWTEAKRLSRRMPVVDADLGKAYLLLKHETGEARQSFAYGIVNDPDNADVYVGLDQATSLSGIPAAERAVMLSRYPMADSAQSKMPAHLVYQLALTRAEAGQFDAALSLFKDRFFPSEEGGIRSDQVLFEVKLMQAEFDAHNRNCGEARQFLVSELAAIGSSNSAQALFRMAGIEQSCGLSEQATAFLTKAASAIQSTTNLSWIAMAEKTLKSSTVVSTEARIRAAMPSQEQLMEINDFSSQRWYAIGMLQSESHQYSAARQSFTNALLLPDLFMSHHLARIAMKDLPDMAKR
jgi:tetratricopeptide (TPR) repeat protein